MRALSKSTAGRDEVSRDCTIRDMVRVEHEMVTEGLRLTGLLTSPDLRWAHSKESRSRSRDAGMDVSLRLGRKRPRHAIVLQCAPPAGRLHDLLAQPRMGWIGPHSRMPKEFHLKRRERKRRRVNLEHGFESLQEPARQRT